MIDEMDALVLTGPGAFEVRRVPIPTPEPDEVLCKVRAVAICGSDPEIIRGERAGIWPPAYPFIPGHEWAGEVVAVGGAIHGFRVGDRVAGQAHKGCGFCDECLAGRYNLCKNYGKPGTGHRHYGFVNNGAYAQYNAYSPKSLTPITNEVGFREAALIDTAGGAMHAMKLTGVTLGGTVVVIGPGPIGIIAMRAAKFLGASRVIVVGRGERLQTASRLGADAVVNFETDEPVSAIRSLTGGTGVNEAFECSGAKGSLCQAVEMVRRGGRIGLVGIPDEAIREEIPFRYVVSNEITICGSRANPNVSGPILSLLAGGVLKLRDLITHVFPLSEFRSAFETFIERRDGALKVVIEPNGACE